MTTKDHPDPSEKRQRDYRSAPKAEWPFRLPDDLSVTEIEQMRRAAENLAQHAQYGWGHTIDFGPFRMEGLLQDRYLQIAGLLDDWGWWPTSFQNMTVADVGCFTGGLSLLMASRGAEKVFAIDEVATHLAQCAFIAGLFQVRPVECLEMSLYDMPKRIPPASLDVIMLSGVLYHLSDMLVGLIALQTLLKPSGILIIESAGIECYEHSYANFARFFGGGWWVPTALCIQDLCEFAGFSRPDLRFYAPQRCLARTVKQPDAQILFKRGMNWPFADLRDQVPRTIDSSVLTPTPCDHDQFIETSVNGNVGRKRDTVSLIENSEFLRVKRPHVVCVRRGDPYRFSVGDEALAELGPGLLRLLNLRDGEGRKLGEAIAPEYTIPFSAASTAAVFVGNLKDRAEPNMWTLVSCRIEWAEPCQEDESLLATARIESPGRTSITFTFDVFSARTTKLIASGKMTLVATGAGGPRPYVSSVLKPDHPPNPTVASVATVRAPASARSLKAVITDDLLPTFISRRLKRLHWRYVYKQRWRNAPVLEWINVPAMLTLNASAEVEIEIKNKGSLPQDLELVMMTPPGFGLDFEWTYGARPSLRGGQSCRARGIIRALRHDEVNLGKPWLMSCRLLGDRKELACITAEIAVPGEPAGKVFYVLTEDCETFDGGERTGQYRPIEFMRNQNNFMDPEDYRIQMIEKPDALNRVAEKHGARFTHFWTSTQRFAAEWVSKHSKTGAWERLCLDLDESIRRGSRQHEYAPNIHFDFEPDSKLLPQPRLIYDRSTDGFIPNEYYDPIENPDHKYHGWDGSRKGIAYVKREGSFGDPDSKTGSLHKAFRYLAERAHGGKCCVTMRTGACDFGAKPEDLGVSVRALQANGILANADAGLYEKVGLHPRGRQMYFCRKDDLESEIEDIRDASLVQLRAPEIQVEGALLEELNAWFDGRIAASHGPGVRAIVAMTHAMFMKGAPDPYRDTVGGDFEKLDKHLEYVRTRYPHVRFATASEAVLDFIDYYTPTLRAVVTTPILQAADGSLLLYSIRILGQGIPVSHSRPMRVTVQASPSIDPAEITSITVLENGRPIASGQICPDRLTEVDFLARDRDGYEMEIRTHKRSLESFCAEDRRRFFTSEQTIYEESENDQPYDLLRLERPQLLSKTVSDEGQFTKGDTWDWLFPGDLFRFLVNPIAGNTEPIGRSSHPYSSHTLGAAIYVAKELCAPRFRPVRADLSCILPVTGRTNFRLRCSIEDIAGEQMILENAVFEAEAHIAQVRVALSCTHKSE